jgi:anthranilate phosphoribosyltransferase
LNASAGLWVAGRVDDLSDGIALARTAIDDGYAQDTLDALIAATSDAGAMEAGS